MKTNDESKILFPDYTILKPAQYIFLDQKKKSWEISSNMGKYLDTTL